MPVEIIAVAPMVLIAAWLMTGLLWRASLRSGRLDVPNARSSHFTPTPTGGGAAIIIAVYAAIFALVCLDALLLDKFLWVFLISGGLIALLGHVDDKYHLPPWVRLIVHLLCALGATYVIGAPPVPFLFFLPDWAVAGFTVLAITWFINLFNFMDGLDGIASSESLTVALAAALISFLTAPQHPITVLFIIFVFATGGFLFWNKPPAKIFMGNAASGFIGLSFAVLALWMVVDGQVSVWVWLILPGVFLTDATWTLLKRFAHRQPIYEAHCSHGYQCMAQLLQHAYRGRYLAEAARTRAHRFVSVATASLNLFWLTPWAIMAVYWPAWEEVIAAIALAPILIGVYQSQNAARAITPAF